MNVVSSLLSHWVIGTNLGRSGGRPVLKSVSEQSCLITFSTMLSLPNLVSTLKIKENVVWLCIVLLFAILVILTAFNFNYTTLVFYILASLISRSPTSPSFTSKGSYKWKKYWGFLYTIHTSLLVWPHF